jgi:hypothetical protein
MQRTSSLCLSKRYALRVFLIRAHSFSSRQGAELHAALSVGLYSVGDGRANEHEAIVDDSDEGKMDVLEEKPVRVSCIVLATKASHALA